MLLIMVRAFDFHLDLTSSAGQILFDSSVNNYDSILGSTLLVESTDAVLTDRGAYFSDGTRISMPPNNLKPTTLLPIAVDYVFVLNVKPLDAGCILSVTNSTTVKLSLCWSAGTVTMIQSGKTLTKTMTSGNL